MDKHQTTCSLCVPLQGSRCTLIRCTFVGEVQLLDLDVADPRLPLAARNGLSPEDVLREQRELAAAEEAKKPPPAKVTAAHSSALSPAGQSAASPDIGAGRPRCSSRRS
jgi:hypothetical protein